MPSCSGKSWPEASTVGTARLSGCCSGPSGLSPRSRGGNQYQVPRRLPICVAMQEALETAISRTVIVSVHDTLSSI
jgi:hypothetical protein